MLPRKVTPSAIASAIVAASAKVKPDELAERVAELLTSERLIKKWPRIVAAIKKQALKAEGKEQITITTATPVSEILSTHIQRKLGPVEFVTDETLLGGAVIRKADRQINLSLHAKIEAMRKRIQV
jgi:F0F1-type ATP synthase delta subunit